MTLLLDEAHVFCDRDPISGRHVLGSAVSFERKSLPQGDFELIFQDGQGFLFRHEDDDGDIAPVSDFMDAEVRATQANSGENPPPPPTTSRSLGRTVAGTYHQPSHMLGGGPSAQWLSECLPSGWA